MEMLFVRGDGVILVRFVILFSLSLPFFIDMVVNLTKRYHHHREHKKKNFVSWELLEFFFAMVFFSHS